MSNTEHPASIYNGFRGILFSLFHKKGEESAYEYLESEIKGHLYNQAYTGLKAELDFYSNYGKEFDLIVAGDYGDKTDFAGTYKGGACRIDVTTNVNVKDLKKYEPFQKKGKKYYIALMNRENGSLIDFIDVNFPFCSICGNRLFDVLVLGPNDKDSEGIRYFGTNEVSIVSVCPYDPVGDSKYIDGNIFPGTFNFTEFIGNLQSEQEFREFGPISSKKYRSYSKMVDDEILRYAVDNIRYFSKYFNRNIVATGSGEYIITNPMNGDGYWGTPLRWIAPIVRKDLFDEIETDLSDIF